MFRYFLQIRWSLHIVAALWYICFIRATFQLQHVVFWGWQLPAVRRRMRFNLSLSQSVLWMVPKLNFRHQYEVHSAYGCLLHQFFSPRSSCKIQTLRLAHGLGWATVWAIFSHWILGLWPLSYVFPWCNNNNNNNNNNNTSTFIQEKIYETTQSGTQHMHERPWPLSSGNCWTMDFPVPWHCA